MRKFLSLSCLLLVVPFLSARAGKVVTHSLSSSILGKQVKYNVYLPDGFDNTGKEYPVVYLLHGLSDDYMNDMSFVVNSYSIGFGVNYKLSKAVTLKAAYFQTNYETKDVDYTPAATDLNQTTHNAFTRTNRVLGIGCEITL